MSKWQGETIVKFILAAFGGVLLSLAAPAAAQEPDPAAVAAAREMLVAQDYLAQMRATAERTTEATFETITRDFETRMGISFPADLEAEVREILRGYTNRALGRMEATALEDAARVYARYFTVAEIMELRRLFLHPVMVRFQNVAPQFTAELMQIGVRASVEEMRELRESIRSAVENWVGRNRDQIRPTAT